MALNNAATFWPLFPESKKYYNSGINNKNTPLLQTRQFVIYAC